MAMIPTTMASTPSRISEVDDDLSTDVGRGVDVDVDMTGVPFVRVRVSFRLSWVRGRGFRSPGAQGLVTGVAATSQYRRAGPPAEGRENITAGYVCLVADAVGTGRPAPWCWHALRPSRWALGALGCGSCWPPPFCADDVGADRVP